MRDQLAVIYVALVCRLEAVPGSLNPNSVLVPPGISRTADFRAAYQMLADEPRRFG